MQTNVLAFLWQSASSHPDKIAIKDEYGQVSFAQLLHAVKVTATYLCRTVGANARKPVAVYMQKRWESVAAFLAVACSGNFYCPLDVQSPPQRIETILHILKTPCVITSEQVNVPGAGDSICFPSVLEAGEVDEHCLQQALDNILDTDPLYVLFTSGSTGIPKGVVIQHKSVIDYAHWLSETFRFDAETVFGSQAPFYFDNSVLDIYSMLANAATMVVIPESLFIFAAKLCPFLKKNGVNTIFWVPSALIGAVNANALNNTELPALEKILFCGEVMPVKQLNVWRRAFPQALFANLYGPTEITDVCTCYILDRDFSDEDVLPIGRARRNTQVFLLDENNTRITQAQVTGEICVRGACLALGYFDNSEKSRQAFVQNPENTFFAERIYRTGDLGRYNALGELEYLCRKDFQIKHQGHRIELGEIEAAAMAQPGMLQCCALYDAAHKKIVLFCAAADGATPKGIYAGLRTRVPAYMLPAHIAMETALPLNANGKIDRVALRQRLENHVC